MKTKLTALLLFSLLSVSSLKASHLAGGSITYQCMGGNTYQIKVTIYRDCKGIALAVPTLTVSGCGNTYTVAYTGTSVVPVLITPSCNSTVKTACDNPPGTAPGIQRFDYSFTDTLPAPLIACSDVIFSYDVAARNAAITTICAAGSVDMYLEAHLNPTAVPCINSPSFNTDPTLFLCLNQANMLDYSAKASCNDSLSYSLDCARQAGGACVPYCNGFGPDSFLTGSIILNPATGILTVTPTYSGTVAVCDVKITQWQKVSGVWTVVGTVMRDIQLYVISCVNNLPTITGIDSTNQYSTIIAADKLTCFNIYAASPNVSDSVLLSWDNEIPTATFSATSASKNDTGLFCWQHTLADTGCAHCFTVIAKDNACPQNGVSYSRYCIFVEDSITLKASDMTVQKYVVTISPNPFSKTATITLSDASQLTDAQFTLSDIFGRSVMNKKMVKNEMVIERGNLAEGIYFYSIKNNDNIIAAGKVLIVE